MDFHEEPRPRRPGQGGQQYHGTEPEDVVPAGYAPAVEDGGDSRGLFDRIESVLAGVEDLWGQVDPRADRADRLRLYVGPCPELLAAFFSRAVLLTSALEEMLERLEKAPAAIPTAARDWRVPHPTPPADLASLVNDTCGGNAVKEAKDRLTAKVIEILGKAGVEVDEADVDSWDEGHRSVAVEWAAAQRRADTGGYLNLYPRPSFLPEA